MSALTIFYPWAYLVSLGGLLGWTLFSDRKSLAVPFQGLFFIGFLTWIMTVFAAEGSSAFKLSVAFRDMLVMSVLSLILSQIKSNKIIGFAIIMVAGIFMKQYYVSVLKSTFRHDTGELYQQGELLIDVGVGNILNVETLLQDYGASMVPAFEPSDAESTDLDDYFIVDMPDHQMENLGELKEALQKLEVVDWVEDNEILRLDPLENEIGGSRTKEFPYGVNDPLAARQWAFAALDIPALHKLVGSKAYAAKKKVLVAILDTGIDGKHEDLKSNYHSLHLPYDGDKQGHGTHVSGIVAAVTNNGLGVASMIPAQGSVQITSVKVLSDGGFGSQAGIIKGMLFAADRGADVISMSLGGKSSDKKQEAYQKAVAYCNQKGSIVVVAAGNANINAKTYAPANTPGVITVSAVNEKLEKAVFSNEVQDLTFGLAAPGVEIHSTFPNNQYRSFKGTSMAAPFVASIIGILKSMEPDLSTSQAYELLSSTGKNSSSPRKTGPIIQPVPALQKLIEQGIL